MYSRQMVNRVAKISKPRNNLSYTYENESIKRHLTYWYMSTYMNNLLYHAICSNNLIFLKFFQQFLFHDEIEQYYERYSK